MSNANDNWPLGPEDFTAPTWISTATGRLLVDRVEDHGVGSGKEFWSYSDLLMSRRHISTEFDSEGNPAWRECRKSRPTVCGVVRSEAEAMEWFLRNSSGPVQCIRDWPRVQAVVVDNFPAAKAFFESAK